MRGEANSIPRKPRGKHPSQRLTAVRVRSLTEPGRHADGNGLYLVVDPSGSKRWLLRTAINRRRCDLGLGSAQLVSLADARAEAARLRRIARDGGDPLAERRRERATAPTFKDAALQVHAAHSSTFRNAKHKAQWLASLAAYVFPAFGDRLVSAIDSRDVLKALTPIWTAKPETARRLSNASRSFSIGRRRPATALATTPLTGLRRCFRAADRPKRTMRHFPIRKSLHFWKRFDQPKPTKSASSHSKFWCSLRREPARSLGRGGKRSTHVCAPMAANCDVAAEAGNYRRSSLGWT
jgi:hypothetical protein